ncbi:MAG: hypothetical protein CVV44_00315 [Spirochaetae bacterium HGW-Spirochaetae-1]|jgi:diguanylate cyclase (GGDEF)-like protein|nr:MAG: hypothetical protein CVV44_00315 [Spirochaetae bacterium HGW-Spirochaetae-1]
MSQKKFDFIKTGNIYNYQRFMSSNNKHTKKEAGLQSLKITYNRLKKDQLIRKEHIRKFRQLIEINTYITNSLEKEEILKRILQQIKDLLQCERSSMLLVDVEVNQLKFAILSKDDEGEMLKDTRLKKGEGIAGTVWSNGTPMIINDPLNDPRFSNIADKKSHMRTSSILAVPLTVDGEIIGVIEAINKINGKFTHFDLIILQYISTQSAIAIKNADLYTMAIKDGMTRLFIHKYFKERLVEELKRSRRYKHPLTLAMFDIDHFKVFNDTYGHQAGDRVLKEVAAVIEDNCRSMDIPCRYGGEEFAVILPETSQNDAIIFMERIRQKIDLMHIEYSGTSLHVTVSAGYSSIPELDPGDAEEFITMADRALYQSKENGRNRITFYSGDTPA